MIFTKKTIWAECEKMRELNCYSTSALSAMVFPEIQNVALYATRRNLLDGGLRIPFTVLKNLGLVSITLSKFNIPTGQVMQAEIDIKNSDMEEITKSLVNAVGLFRYNTPLTKLPQTLRKAITKGKAGHTLSLTTFEKAFDAIGDVSVRFNYKAVDPESVEGMF